MLNDLERRFAPILNSYAVGVEFNPLPAVACLCDPGVVGISDCRTTHSIGRGEKVCCGGSMQNEQHLFSIIVYNVHNTYIHTA